jgi:hypothetical protein
MPAAPGKVYVRDESARGVFLDASFLVGLHAYIASETDDAGEAGSAVLRSTPLCGGSRLPLTTARSR